MCVVTSAKAQEDTVLNATLHAVPRAHQLRLGVDIGKPVINAFIKSRYSYEAAVDYALKKEVYLTAEGGWGGSDVDYTDLKYSTRNTFVKFGFDKTMVPRLFPSDWDMLFVGLRYGIAFLKRNDATYTTDDGFWGTTTGTIGGKSITGHWAEITAGIRVELWKGVFAGYTVRGKFLINQKAFKELPPQYIAGYGKGEKATVFDFNFYLQYALRW